jgi:hypothetical protein
VRIPRSVRPRAIWRRLVRPSARMSSPFGLLFPPPKATIRREFGRHAARGATVAQSRRPVQPSNAHIGFARRELCGCATCLSLARRLQSVHRLAGPGPPHHPAGMFVVTEAEATAIRAAFDRGGELSAAAELRRLFPGVADMAEARDCARTIAAWEPLPVTPAGQAARQAAVAAVYPRSASSPSRQRADRARPAAGASELIRRRWPPYPKPDPAPPPAQPKPKLLPG